MQGIGWQSKIIECKTIKRKISFKKDAFNPHKPTMDFVINDEKKGTLDSWVEAIFKKR